MLYNNTLNEPNVKLLAEEQRLEALQHAAEMRDEMRFDDDEAEVMDCAHCYTEHDVRDLVDVDGEPLCQLCLK